jgi:hypothetical protein
MTRDQDLTYAVTVNGSLQARDRLHIHRSAAGNGPISLSLVALPRSPAPSPSAPLTSPTGRLYLNVHSTANPGGFARAQLILPAAAAPITPPSTGDAGLAGSSAASLLPLAGLVLAFSAGSLALAGRRA